MVDVEKEEHYSKGKLLNPSSGRGVVNFFQPFNIWYLCSPENLNVDHSGYNLIINLFS